MTRAKKWNFKTHEYQDVCIPIFCSVYEDDMAAKVMCPHCGRVLPFGDCYTSRQIHTNFGLGYAVCEKCYEKEWDEEREAIQEAAEKKDSELSSELNSNENSKEHSEAWNALNEATEEIEKLHLDVETEYGLIVALGIIERLKIKHAAE